MRTRKQRGGDGSTVATIRGLKAAAKASAYKNLTTAAAERALNRAVNTAANRVVAQTHSAYGAYGADQPAFNKLTTSAAALQSAEGLTPAAALAKKNNRKSRKLRKSKKTRKTKA